MIFPLIHGGFIKYNTAIVFFSMIFSQMNNLKKLNNNYLNPMN